MRADRREHWTKTVAEQSASGLSVRAFCDERGVCAASFYHWRRRLGSEGGGVSFALVETRPSAHPEVPLELIFTSGERLRISPGADAATLQMVVAALRA